MTPGPGQRPGGNETDVTCAAPDLVNPPDLVDPPDLVAPAEPAAPPDVDVVAVLEALLVVADGPLDPVAVAAALPCPVGTVTSALAEIAAGFEDGRRGMRLRRSVLGWQLHAAPEHREIVQRLVIADQPTRLTQAALETLAIVAYRQPVSRGRVSAIRGVSVDAVMRSLQSRGLVEERGHEPVTGAVLYGTTPAFLSQLGLDSVEELPSLGPLLPEAAELVAGMSGPDGFGAGAAQAALAAADSSASADGADAGLPVPR